MREGAAIGAAERAGSLAAFDGEALLRMPGRAASAKRDESCRSDVRRFVTNLQHDAASLTVSYG